MITTPFYIGQGLGNQLWCYVVTRTIAEDKGYDFTIGSPENFKGLDFMKLDFGKQTSGHKKFSHYYQEQKILHPLNGADIRIHDTDLINIPDDTLIDGIMQDEGYIAHKKDSIRTWLKVDQEHDCRDFSSDTVCIVNFRGSGYVNEKELLLPPSYWQHAMAHMRKINPRITFVVITEDPATAKAFFPNMEIHHFSIAKDYSIIKNAHYLILSNSSFAWFPAWLSTDLKFCIAPKYWARHNISDGFWSPGYSITTGWMYQDRRGVLWDHHACRRELEMYLKENKAIYSGVGTYRPSLSTSVKELARIFHTLRTESSLREALVTMIGMSTRRTVLRLRKIMNGDMIRKTNT